MISWRTSSNYAKKAFIQFYYEDFMNTEVFTLCKKIYNKKTDMLTD